MADLAFHLQPGGVLTAYRMSPGIGPLLVFLPGYMSDMSGSKATALLSWAQEHGRACLLLDYSGCGQSSGSFADGTLTRWRDEVLGLIDAVAAGPGITEPVVLVGSSMGGWLMVLVALALPPGRCVGLVGVAAAPDFTEWGYSDALKARLTNGELVFESNPYGPEPTPTHSDLWRDGQENLLLGGSIALTCPVRLVHGQADPDVPWETAQRLAKALRSDDVQVTLIKDGDHRLSRSADLAVLLRVVAMLLKGD